MSYNESTIRAAMSRSLKVGHIEKFTTPNGRIIQVLGEIVPNGYYVLRYSGKRGGAYAGKDFFIEIEILGSSIATIRSFLDVGEGNDYEPANIKVVDNGVVSYNYDPKEKYYTLEDGEYVYMGATPEFDPLGGTTYYIKHGFNIYIVPETTGNKLILLESSNIPVREGEDEYAITYAIDDGELNIEYALTEFRAIHAANVDDNLLSSITNLNFPGSLNYVKGYFNVAQYESNVSLDGDASITADRVSTPELVASSLSFNTQNIEIENGISVGELSINHLHTDNFQTTNIAADDITTPIIRIGHWEIKPESRAGTSIAITYNR